MPRQSISNTVEDVVYHKKDHTEGFVVIANEGMTEKWRKDKTIPLVEVVNAFEIYEHEAGGNSGILRSPPKQALMDNFNTHNETEVIQFILNNGKIQASTAHKLSKAGNSGARNEGRGRGAPNVQAGVHG